MATPCFSCLQSPQGRGGGSRAGVGKEGEGKGGEGSCCSWSLQSPRGEELSWAGAGGWRQGKWMQMWKASVTG